MAMHVRHDVECLRTLAPLAGLSHDKRMNRLHALRPAFLAVGLVLLMGCSISQAAPQLSMTESAAEPVAEPVSRADRALHERILTLDSHLDSPMHFGRVGWDITQRHSVATDASQLDLPRMVEGGLDGGFFVIYMPQGELTEQGYAKSFADALRRAAAIQQTVTRHADAFAFATTSAEARAANAAGKRVVFQSMENSYPLGLDLRNLALFHKLGVRMAGPVHNGASQFSDSVSGDPLHGGLSPLGRKWVAEMNRLGMIIDGSHASDLAFDQMLALSKAPIVLSHSGSKTVFDHRRNLDDSRLKALAAKGGVLQVNSLFLKPITFAPALGDVMDAYDYVEDLAPDAQARLAAERHRLTTEFPPSAATFDDFMASLLHAIRVMGVDHVGIGADWDGGGGVAGMRDITALPQITAGLRKAGYSEVDIEKIWSGNLLRVLDRVQAVAVSR